MGATTVYSGDSLFSSWTENKFKNIEEVVSNDGNDISGYEVPCDFGDEGSN